MLLKFLYSPLNLYPMKYLLLAVFALTTFLVPQQKVLTGKYKMIFEKQYGSQSGNIQFEKNTYTRRGTDGKAIKGIVEYSKDAVVLKDEKTGYIVEISAKTIGQETVLFRTLEADKKAEAARGDMVFYPGKMIKMKDK